MLLIFVGFYFLSKFHSWFYFIFIIIQSKYDVHDITVESFGHVVTFQSSARDLSFELLRMKTLFYLWNLKYFSECEKYLRIDQFRNLFADCSYKYISLSYSFLIFVNVFSVIISKTDFKRTSSFSNSHVWTFHVN